MKTLSVFGKYLDQPKLVENFSRSVPAILIAGGTLYALNNVRKAPEGNKKKQLIKDVAVLTGTIGAALLAPKLARKLIKNSHEHGHGHVHSHSQDISNSCKPAQGSFQIHKKSQNGINKNLYVNKNNSCNCHEHNHLHAHPHGCINEQKQEGSLIDNFLKNNSVGEKTAAILKKSEEKVLSFSEVKTIFNDLGKNKDGKELLNKLIPSPENIDSKHVFSEVGRLSIIGLMPVLGGITGGVIGDKLTEKDWKKRIPDKIKEGSYQYLANIFLCNIGAGAALLAMEKANVQSKAVRAVAMIGGILLTGLVFGSAMANYLGKKLIDPILGNKTKKGGLYSERTPEAIDVSLHIDDVTTVAVLSGLKWIEPALPILYSISGYRAGIGYRNGEEGD